VKITLTPLKLKAGGAIEQQFNTLKEWHSTPEITETEEMNRRGGCRRKRCSPRIGPFFFSKKKIETGLTNRVYKFDRRDGDGTSGDLRRAMVSTEEANGFDLDAKAH
jgi:hypothetical protein